MTRSGTGGTVAGTPAAAWAGSLAVIAALAFAVLASLVSGGRTAVLDAGVRGWAMQHQCAAAAVIATAASAIGASVILFPLCIVLALWLGRRAGPRPAAVMVVGPLASDALVWTIKSGLHRLRPPGAALHFTLGYSFPSAHAANNMTAALVLGYLLLRHGRLTRRRSSVGAALAVALAILIGLSRIYLDVHWASDVAGGWLLGVAVASVAAAIDGRGRVGDGR